MAIKIFFTLTFFLILFRLEGQTPLSFAKGDLVGVEDANQNVILEPKFTQIKIHPEYGIIAAQLNNIWHFYNFSGRLLVKSDFKRYKIESLHGKHIDDRFVEGSFVPLSHLVAIQEDLNGPRYVLNALTPDIEPKYFQSRTSIKFEKTWFHDLNAYEIGIVKISREDQQVNFIDSTGNYLFHSWFPRAYLVAEDFIAIDTGAGLMALYTKSFSQRSKFSYDKIVGSENPDYFLADHKSDQGVRTYFLLDTTGNIIFKSDQPIKSVDQKLVIVNNSISGLYTYEGKAIIEFENSSLDYLGPEKDRFKLIQNGKTGIINRDGDVILEPFYDKISTTEREYIIGYKGIGSTLLDEKFNVVFHLDSVQISSVDPIPGFLKGSKRVANKDRQGLVDSLGKTVLPFEHQSIFYDKAYNLIIAEIDSMTALYDENMSILLPYREGHFTGNRELIEFYFIAVDSVWVYKRSGELLMRFANGNPQIRASNYYEYLPGVFGRNGEVLFLNTYRQLFSNGISGSSKLVTIGRAKNRSDPFNHVFNNDRKWILPDEYALMEKFTNGHTGTNGMIIVHNMQDVLQKKDIPRAGVIDMEGQWVLPPSSQRIRVNDNNEIEVLDPVTKSIKIISLKK